MKEQSLPGLLASMRISLHVLFAGLLLIGLATAIGAGSAGVITWLLAPVLAAAYLAGTVFEHRTAGSNAYRRLQRLAPAWLAIVLAIWVALVFDAAQFIWLLFPLVFLILHVLPPVSGHLVVLAAWLVAVVLPPATGQWPVQVAAVLGPLIGTLAAVVGFRFYQLLRADAVEQRRIAETLRATRRELAATENRAGRLAERERLAREIHDTLAQGLSSIVLLSRAAGRSLEAGQPDTARSQVAAIEDTAAENLAEARNFVAGLTSPVLVDSLPDGLRALVDTTRQRITALGTATDLQLTVVGEDRPGPHDEVAAAAMRVAQEALANALRHAEASRIAVTYVVLDDEITLDIVDDGRGFDPAATERTSEHGFGLRGLDARVREAGGVLTVESTPARGTAVAASFPLHASDKEQP